VRRAGRIAAVVLALAAADALAMLAPESAPPLPEFSQSAPAAWLNSAPLKVADLAGSVVLLEFWTFDCVNCRRSVPWLKEIEARLGPKGLRVIGIHTPEFAHEKVRANVASKTRAFGITHPVMLDPDFYYWNALGNQYWPAFYLVDRKGRLRALFVGETHIGDAQARRIEDAIATLIAE
jgi:thiol-disulfide isomerase/thioredoxin